MNTVEKLLNIALDFNAANPFSVEPDISVHPDSDRIEVKYFMHDMDQDEMLRAGRDIVSKLRDGWTSLDYGSNEYLVRTEGHVRVTLFISSDVGTKVLEHATGTAPTRVGDVVTDIDSLAFLTVVRDYNDEVFERWGCDKWARAGYSSKEKTVPRAPVTVIYVPTEEDSK